MKPEVKVFGVQPARIPSMKAAVAKGKPVTLDSAKTIADGIAVRRAGERTLPLVQKYVDDIVTVEEEEIANAILLLNAKRLSPKAPGPLPLPPSSIASFRCKGSA